MAALLGAGAALAIDEALGGDEGTTVVREVAQATQSPAAFDSGEGKTIADIYRQSGRGVGHIVSRRRGEIAAVRRHGARRLQSTGRSLSPPLLQNRACELSPHPAPQWSPR